MELIWTCYVLQVADIYSSKEEYIIGQGVCGEVHGDGFIV